jgi:hypothetical protein
MIGEQFTIRIRPYYAHTRKLTQIISGNTDTNKDGNVALLQSPDNICVTEFHIHSRRS